MNDAPHDWLHISRAGEPEMKLPLVASGLDHSQAPVLDAPPGVPAIAPGEVVTQEVLDYLTSGVAADMLIPDAADPEISSLRVVAG